MAYKARFYEHYYSTHLRHRKGPATLNQFQSNSPVFEQYWRKLLPQDKEARIIDVGCGTGNFLWWLQQQGYFLSEGIDLSPEQVAIANDLGVRNVLQGDLHSILRERQGCYAVIILRDVIEHFDKVEVIEALEICRAALLPGGRIVLQVPNAQSPFFGRIRYGDFTHELAFSATSLQQVLQVMGYGDIQTYSTGPVMAGRRSLVRYFAWKLVEAIYRLLIFIETGKKGAIVSEGIIAVGISHPN
jgi:2-polyprenyl-3-methyl-5-hydroxy-6-metoxy-1,4-benzoquinol methylase